MICTSVTTRRTTATATLSLIATMMVMVMSERDKGTWVNEEKENVTEKTCGGGELIIRKGCDWDSVE